MKTSEIKLQRPSTPVLGDVRLNTVSGCREHYSGSQWVAVENQSGVYPTEFKVLLKPKEVQEKTKGGIILPDETKERDQFAQMEGMIVAVSPLAFTYSDDWGTHQPPKPGDRVLFAKYSGAKVTGKDGQEYRLVNDKDVAAVLS